MLRREFPSGQVILRGDSERVRDTIEEREHRRDIHGFRDLIFQPARIAEFLHILRSRAIGGFCDQLHVIE